MNNAELPNSRPEWEIADEVTRTNYAGYFARHPESKTRDLEFWRGAEAGAKAALERKEQPEDATDDGDLEAMCYECGKRRAVHNSGPGPLHLFKRERRKQANADPCGRG